MAIRLIFTTMKKILISIIICVLGGIAHAQDMIVTFASNSATITIDGKKFETKNQINICKEIKSIKIEESPGLTVRKKHYLKVNDQKIALSSQDANIKDSCTYNLNKPFTIHYSNVIKVFRDEDLCGTFNVVKPISEKDVIENVKFNREDIKSIKRGERKNVVVTLENPLKITLENVKVLIGKKEVKPSFDNKTLKFELSLENNVESADVKIKYDVKGHAELKGLEYQLYTITLEKSPFENVIGVIVGVVVLVLVLWLFWFAKSTPVKTKKGKTFRLLLGANGVITNGNKSLISGTYESLDGHIYKLKRKKWYALFSRLCFIGVKIECPDNGSFVLEECNEIPDNVGLIHHNNGTVDRIIAVGMKAYNDGVYVLEDKSEININGGEIQEVKKYILSTRNTPHYISLNSDEPQVNDLVTPKNKKKQYTIETSEGVRYDVCNNRIQKISNTNNSQTNQVELVASNGKTIIVIPKGEIPTVGDIAIAAEGEYVVGNMVYVIEEGKIKSITRCKDEEQYTIPELLEIVNQLRNENNQLQKRPTQESYDLLKEQCGKTDDELAGLKKKYEDVDKTIESAKAKARTEEKKRLETIHKKDIIDNYILLSEHKQKLSQSEKVAKEAIGAKETCEKSLKMKETELATATGKISELEKAVHDKETEIITHKAAIAKIKETAQKKNVHFVYQVQETLEEISNTFKDVYKDITNSTIKDGLISPMLKGVSGLGAGILSWAEDYTVKVKGDSEGFFGGDYMTMKEEDVKETISKKFISNIVKSDSFSKFVRLYQLSNVPFIRKQFVEAGMNIDVLNKLYYKVYVLVSEFGYQIICPRLFEEQHSDKKYQWFNSTNLFNIIDFPEEEKKAIKELGPETIVDVNQIGFISPWASRNATAVTPDF